MKASVKHPRNFVRVSELPKEIRGSYHPDATVRVSLELVRDENGFTPEEAQATLQAVEESKNPHEMIGPFESTDEVRDYLDRLAS